MKRSSRPPISTVLFDLGGVLANDIFEHVLFDRRSGLAPRGWVARRRWRAAAAAAWEHAAIAANATEANFWADFDHRTGAAITPAAITASERRVVRANPDAARVMSALTAGGYQVGLISDNTAFWYPRQLTAIDAPAPNPHLVFLSYQRGRTKAAGLYALAATTLNPDATLVVEDRPHLRALARAAGFRVAAYNLSDHRSLAAAIRRAGLDIAAESAS